MRADKVFPTFRRGAEANVHVVAVDMMQADGVVAIRGDADADLLVTSRHVPRVKLEAVVQGFLMLSVERAAMPCRGASLPAVGRLNDVSAPRLGCFRR